MRTIDSILADLKVDKNTGFSLTWSKYGSAWRAEIEIEPTGSESIVRLVERYESATKAANVVYEKYLALTGATAFKQQFCAPSIEYHSPSDADEIPF